jgi:DNA-binding NarL/FixJ family response regulator
MVAKPVHQSASRVLILSDQSLFHLGIQNLLEQDTVLDIIGCELGGTEIMDHIRATRPDVIILDGDHPPATIASEIMDILRDVPGISLMGISYQHNTLCVYRGETQEVRDVADLLKAIDRRTTIVPTIELGTEKGEA